MKQTIKSIFSILLALTIVLTVAGCGGNETKTSEPVGVNDDFFADSETTMSTPTNSDENSNTESTVDSNIESTVDSNIDSNASSTNTPTENKVGGKSWNDVLSSMPKSLRGTTVTMYNWNPMSEYTGAAAAIEKFEKQTGIKVKWETVDLAVYTTRLASRVASGQAPDVVRTRTPVPSWLVSFQPLSSVNYDFTDGAWDQQLMKDYSVNGVAYATSLKNTHIGSVDMMFYNKDLISKYDYEDPYKLWKNGKWTWSKFIEMCKEFKDETGADISCGGGTWEVYSELFGVPGPIAFDGNKYYSLLKDNKFLTVTQDIANLHHVDKILGEGRAEGVDAGEILFYAGASIYLRRNNSYLGELKAAGSLYAVPMPAIDGQSTYYQGKNEYEAYAIAQGAKNAEAVPYFLRYFLDGQNYDLTSFFCNKQNLEVYNWCMSQENTIWSTYYRTNDDTFGDGKEGLFSLQGSQIKSFIDSNSHMIDTRVKNYNNLLTQLNK